ncbi:MAG: glycosyltransferase family 2 protein [Chitinophagaceae bacterium]|nr:glycosyltransferase family 2 protein [Chitinophagaceae bacterium]
MNLAPIVLFTYNRPWHTAQTLRSLADNLLSNESELIIYVDGPKPNAPEDNIKNILLVRELVQKQTWCKKLTVNISTKNKGLSNSIIDGVSETLKTYDRIIVLEDDMILSPHFLEFMNEALEKYQDIENVISIHGYCLPIDYPEPVFLLKGADCWGWGTWRRGWDLFNPDSQLLMAQLKDKKLQYQFDLNGSYPYTKMLNYQIRGKVDSWAIRWHASAYLQNKLTLYPGKSLVQNIGGDGSGTHSQNEEHTKTILKTDKIILKDIPVVESCMAKKLIIERLTRNLSLKNRFIKIIRALR